MAWTTKFNDNGVGKNYSYEVGNPSGYAMDRILLDHVDINILYKVSANAPAQGKTWDLGLLNKGIEPGRQITVTVKVGDAPIHKDTPIIRDGGM